MDMKEKQLQSMTDEEFAAHLIRDAKTQPETIAENEYEAAARIRTMSRYIEP